MSVTVSITDAREHLSDLVDRIRREHQRFVLTRNKKPVAILMSVEDLESLEETLEVLQDPELVDSIRRSRKEAARGEKFALEDDRG